MICTRCSHQCSSLSVVFADQNVENHRECTCGYCNCIKYAIDYPELSSLDVKK